MRSLPLRHALAQGGVADFDLHHTLIDIDVDSIALVHRGDGPPNAASGDTWPIIRPRVAPLKRPSVSRATDPPSPSPTIGPQGTLRMRAMPRTRPGPLVGEGLGGSVALLTDGRFSGATRGLMMAMYHRKPRWVGHRRGARGRYYPHRYQSACGGGRSQRRRLAPTHGAVEGSASKISWWRVRQICRAGVIGFGRSDHASAVATPNLRFSTLRLSPWPPGLAAASLWPGTRLPAPFLCRIRHRCFLLSQISGDGVVIHFQLEKGKTQVVIRALPLRT